MSNFPHAETPFARAMWSVEHHRTHELQLDGLTAEELGTVRAALVRRLHRARARQVKALVAEASLAVAFVALGIALMMLGPLEMTRQGPGLMIYAKVALYGALIVFLVIGMAGADYLLRKRKALARGRRRAVTDLREALARVDAA